jgi:hypothetical protein
MTCTVCDKPHKFIDEDLPVGPRAFCTEKCWAIYNAMQIKPEGYYGFVDVAFRGA